jgi:hypothetical protein
VAENTPTEEPQAAGPCENVIPSLSRDLTPLEKDLPYFFPFWV